MSSPTWTMKRARLFSTFRFHGIPLHDFAGLVDGEAAFAGGDGDAAEVAAGAFAGGFCPAGMKFNSQSNPASSDLALVVA